MLKWQVGAGSRSVSVARYFDRCPHSRRVSGEAGPVLLLIECSGDLTYWASVNFSSGY